MPKKLLVLLLLALPFAAFAERRPDPVTRAAEAEARFAAANQHSLRATAHLLRLHQFKDEVDDLSLLARTYGLLLTRPRVPPEVRSLARRLLADVERSRGRTNKAAEWLSPLGYVRQYYVAGPFENEGRGGCDTDFGPEASVDLRATYPARAREVGWRRLQEAAPDGYVDLLGVVRPNREVVVYALTLLEAQNETRAVLSTGTTGAFRLWVNGQRALSRERYNQARPDQAKVSVRLRKGVNRVLLKVCQESGPLGFYLRQEKEASSRWHAQPKLVYPLPDVPKGGPLQPAPVPSLPELFEAELKKAPKDPELRGEYATVLEHFKAFEEKEHAPAMEAERAVESAPENLGLRLLAARLHDDDPNARRRHLEKARALEPGSPLALFALAQHERSMDHPERALGLLEEVLKAEPDFVLARLELARVYEDLDELPRAAQLFEQVLATSPSLPPAVREAARSSQRLGRTAEAIERLRLALALRFTDEGSRRALIHALGEIGRVGDAEKELEVQLRLEPFDRGAKLELAELLAANGQLEEGLARFEDAKGLNPEEPEVFERQGRALLSAGRKAEALEAFDRAIALKPQNPALKEAVRSLRGEGTSTSQQLAANPLVLLGEAAAFPGKDAVFLVDASHVTVQKNGLSSRLQQMVVKVNNARGVEAYRSIPIRYSPNRQEVKVVRARIVKPDGTVVDSFGEVDRDLNEPWSRMYYDARVRVLSFPALAPGDVLELVYRREDVALDNLLSDYWGDVDYVQAQHPKVRYQFVVDMPKGRPLYWNESKVWSGLTFSRSETSGERARYRWVADKVPEVVVEPMMPGWTEVAATLHVSTYRTWDEVGQYYWGLVQGQLVQSDELRKTVDKVLLGVDRRNTLAVVRAVYNFVVTNTRYVALEFGIHGYKPYRVDRVLARRFGDCKDKASLIVTMLKVAGVESRLVLLRMRQLGAIGREPASLAAFNHAIAYVPALDLFLDGTAEFHSSSELPGADRVADVLVVEPSGPSRFFTTPEAKAEDNHTRLELKVKLALDGSAEASGKSVISGTGAPEYRKSYQAAATRKASFEQGWSQVFPGLTVDELTLNDVTRLDEDVTLQYRLQIPRFAERQQRALTFYALGGARQVTQAYAPLKERKNDLVLMQGPWLVSTEVRYHLPAGYAATQKPEGLLEESPFGRFELGCEGKAEELVCRGSLAVTTSRVKAQDYPAFRAFLGRVDEAFSRKVVVAGPGESARR